MQLPAEKTSRRAADSSTVDQTLSLDIGGTLLKAAVVDPEGNLVAEPVRTETPKPAGPGDVMAALTRLTHELPVFGRVSIGFPGVVERRCVQTAPNLGTSSWRGYDLVEAVEQSFGRPARMLNDAIVYGLGAAKGPGSECVLTFGTGMGCALFSEGQMFQGLELGQHYARDGLNYDCYIGHNAFVEVGPVIWNERAAWVLDAVHKLTNCDKLHIGGGNSRRLTFPLPAHVALAPSHANFAGGARLWHQSMDRWFVDSRRSSTAAS